MNKDKSFWILLLIYESTGSQQNLVKATEISKSKEKTALSEHMAGNVNRQKKVNSNEEIKLWAENKVMAIKD